MRGAATTSGKAGVPATNCRDSRTAPGTASGWTDTSPLTSCAAMPRRSKPACVSPTSRESIFPVNSAFAWRIAGPWPRRAPSSSHLWRNRWMSLFEPHAAYAAMIAVPSLLIWLYLFFAHGRFWQSAPQLEPATPPEFPDVDIVVPARDEADTIRAAIGSLIAQDYAGRFRVILVDDNSTDGTAALAGAAARLTVITLQSKPEGWSGKLWALAQGVAASHAPVLLFTDADIVHDPRHLSTLVAKLLQSRLDLVSEMVRLECSSFAERALVPAFVYFFQMLYPFDRVNDSQSSVAAAAGGTVLIRREVLERIGGIESIKDCLIDDVALAQAVKACGSIYLGHSGLAASMRPYRSFADI